MKRGFDAPQAIEADDELAALLLDGRGQLLKRSLRKLLAGADDLET